MVAGGGGGGRSPPKKFRPFRPQFGIKIRGGPAPPRSATGGSLVCNELLNRVVKKCDVKEIQICEIIGLVGIFTGFSRTLKVLEF